MGQKVEINIQGKKLRPERFITAVQAFFELIRGVAKNVSKMPVEWNVEVDKGSTVVRAIVENPSRGSEESIESVGRGVRALRSGTRVMPHGFTKEEVVAARKLASLMDGQEIESVLIKNGSDPEEFTAAIIQSADAILLGESYDAFGSVEGTIDSLSARQAFCCVMYDPIHRRDIACYLLKLELQDTAIEAFRRRSKVLVSGMIHYAKEGYPANITANVIRIFPPESELPTLEEVQEIYRQYS